MNQTTALRNIRAGELVAGMVIAEDRSRLTVTKTYHHFPYPGSKEFGRAHLGEIWVTVRDKKSTRTRVYDVAQEVDVL